MTTSKVGVQFLLFASGLMSGILLESRVFHYRRMTLPGAAATALPASSSVSVSPSSNSTDQRPSISVDNPLHDFGVAETGDKIEHSFVIKNVGRSRLTVTQVRASCGCTTAEIADKEIEPGGSRELKVVLDLRDRRGSQNSVVTVKSNDPEHDELKLSLVGSAVSRVTISPPLLDVGRVVSTEAGVAKPVQILTAQGLELKVTDVSTSSPSIVAAVDTTVEASHRITVSILPGLEPGPLRGWVKVHTNHQNQYREISIPVSGYVGMGGPVIVGDELDVAGPTLDGSIADLRALRGKIAIVVFWASWCGHCQRELPELLTLYKHLNSEGLEILGVNCDSKSEEARAAIDKWKIPWPNIHIGQDDPTRVNPLMTRLQIKGIPAIFVVGRDGRVNHVGLRHPVLKVRVEQLLKAQELSASTSD